MASTVPAKSRPVYNFPLPQFEWKKDDHSHGHHRRRSATTKSMSRKSHPPSVSPLRESLSNSLLRDSVFIPPPRRQSALHDSAQLARLSPVHCESRTKSPRRGESSKQFMITESVRKSPSRGDSMKQAPVRGESVKQSSNRGNKVKHPPMGVLASESEASMKSRDAFIEYRRNNSGKAATGSTKNGIYSPNSDWALEKSEKKSRSAVADFAGNKAKKSKILIKIPHKNRSEEDNHQEETQKIDNNDEEQDHQEGKINNNDDDDEPKTWNLRPRKSIQKSLNVNDGAGKYNGSGIHHKKDQSPTRNFNNRSGENESNGCGTYEKKEKRKRKFSIELLKEEIEEDFFIMTGAKPARRPKKRARTIQKQLDNLFPGLWLSSITPDSYKVNENLPKG